jgi:hypothetical protein
MKEDVDRLLRAAALSKEDAPAEMPFGFDTRVVAHWRAGAGAASVGLARLLRQVALAAAAIMIIAGTAAYIEAEQNRETGEPFANDFAIAAVAIQDEIGP